MKKIFILSFIFTFAVCNIYAAENHRIKFHITGGGTSVSASAKQAMEDNAVQLLTMLSEAQEKGSSSLNFNGINISEDAKTSIKNLWRHVPLKIRNTNGSAPEVLENLLTMTALNNYQVRNFPVYLFPEETPDESKASSVSINFSSSGRIEDFNIAIDKNEYDSLLQGALSVQNKENIAMIIYWMDQLKTAYETKNLKYLESLFDKDALIITGVRKAQRSGIETQFADKETFEYFEKNRSQYMASMKRVFNNNKVIRVNFKDQDYAFDVTSTIKFPDGNTAPRYYMVWCTQEWNATRYSDVGRLFLLWDFKNPEKPVILVRAWTHPDDPKQFDIDDFELNM